MMIEAVDQLAEDFGLIGRPQKVGLALTCSAPMKLQSSWHLKRTKRPIPAPFVPKWRERAEKWAAGLSAGNWPNRAALAKAEGDSRAYVAQLLGRINMIGKAGK
jgi:hypothetical protein